MEGVVRAAKVKQVEELLDRLEKNKLGKDALLAALSELKVLGREVENADPLYTARGIKVLCSYAFDEKDVLARREAQRCLANALYLKPDTRKIFVEVGGLEQYAAAFKATLKKRDSDDDFLLGRIGFLLTAQKDEIVERLVNEEGILTDLTKILMSYLKSNEKTGFSAAQSTPLMEQLKFLYNLTFHVKVPENDSESYDHSIFGVNARLLSILVKLFVSFPFTKYESPITNIIHCLLNLPLVPSQPDFFPREYPTQVVTLIINRIDNTIPEDTDAIADNTLDEDLSPVFALLSNIYDAAPETIQNTIKLRLLPTEEDRNLPLGKGTSLSSRLLRLVTNAFTPTLREAIFSFMFQLVNSSPSALVDAIGYGYASGYLFSHNIPIPPNLQNQASGRNDINPVTGQRLDAEPVPNLADMTDEEKEREAERLFVLFERMRSLGVGVENPVRTAQQSGKFEELD